MFDFFIEYMDVLITSEWDFFRKSERSCYAWRIKNFNAGIGIIPRWA